MNSEYFNESTDSTLILDKKPEIFAYAKVIRIVRDSKTSLYEISSRKDAESVANVINESIELHGNQEILKKSRVYMSRLSKDRKCGSISKALIENEAIKLVVENSNYEAEAMRLEITLHEYEDNEDRKLLLFSIEYQID